MELKEFYEKYLQDLKVLNADNPLYVLDKMRLAYKETLEEYRDDKIMTEIGELLTKEFNISKTAVTASAFDHTTIMRIIEKLGYSIEDRLINLIKTCRSYHCGECPSAHECPMEFIPSDISYKEAIAITNKGEI